MYHLFEHIYHYYSTVGFNNTDKLLRFAIGPFNDLLIQSTSAVMIWCV
jgi:hypothetical protein